MFGRKKLMAVLLAAVFVLTAVPIQVAVAGQEARGVQAAVQTGAPSDGELQLLARHRRRRYPRGRRRFPRRGRRFPTGRRPVVRWATVPNVVKRPYATAYRTIRGRGLTARRARSFVNTRNRALHYRVARQNPQARARIRQGRAVTLTLYHYLASKPPPRRPVLTPRPAPPRRPVLTPRPPPPPAPAGQVSVPGVINQFLGTAQKTLRSRGLGSRVAGFVQTRNRNLSSLVVRQNPVRNTRVKRGTTVDLTFYCFPVRARNHSVPNVMIQTLASAQKILSCQGLSARVAGYAKTTKRAWHNRVVKTNPRVGQVINWGAVVQLTLGRFTAAPAPRPPAPRPVPAQVTVPSVINQPVASAQNILRSRGLGYQVAGFVNTPNRAQSNRVARQNPLPNTRVRRGTAVSLTPYRFAAPRPPSPPAPPAVVTVPNLANQPLATALARLGRAGLIPGSTTWQSTRNSALSLRVRSQSPKANSRVRRGSAVQVRVYWLASPPVVRRPPAPRPTVRPPVPQVTVPDVLRQPYGTAENILRAKKLNVRVAGYIHTSNRALRYRVLRQSPAPNARTRRGNVVSLTLYRYSAATPPSPPPFRVIVPSVIRQPYVIATDILRTRGLRARVVGYTSTPNRDLNGWVQQQDPAPRTRTNRGDPIRLWLYRFVPPPRGTVVVPSVLQQPYTTASNILAAKRFNVRVAGYINTSNRARHNRVASQNPAPNARVNRGTVISVTLYRFR